MNKNSLYRDLTSLGTKYELNIKMNDAVEFVEWTEQNFDYVKYNPRKDYRRYGLSITSLDGGLSGKPDLDSVYDYNRENNTEWTERDFTKPTPVYEWKSLQECLEPFKEYLFRTHIIRLDTGGFFPPHRDHPDEYQFHHNSKVVFDTFRLVMPLKNCYTPGVVWIIDDNIPTQWVTGRLYYVDTAKIHTLFNTTNDPSYWLIVNVDVNEESVKKVCQLLKQR